MRLEMKGQVPLLVRRLLLSAFAFHACFDLRSQEHDSGPLLKLRPFATRFWAEPVQISEVSGSSPAFVPEWRTGLGYGLDAHYHAGKTSSIFLRATYDRIPIAYRLDAKRADHPNVGLPFDVEDANLSYKFSRFSTGIGYQYGFRLTRRISIDLSAGLMYQFAGGVSDFDVGVGARNDSVSIWVMGLDVDMRSQSSRWRWLGSIGNSYELSERHSVGISISYDRPFESFFTNGRVILFGLSEYRTMLEFSQSGAIAGISLYYTYSICRSEPSLRFGKH